MAKRKKRALYYCCRCGKPLDPNGKLHVLRNHTYCRACFRATVFKCQRCQGLYTMTNRGFPNHRICVRCAGGGRDNVASVSWPTGKEIVGATFNLIESKRRFGVEIETAQCQYVGRIKGKTSFGAKYDATVSGREFDSPILSGDEGHATIHNFCDIAKRRGWEVDNNCGTHVHLDMSRESSGNLASIAIAYLYTYPTWAKLVHPRRLSEEYCAPPSYSADAIKYSRFSDIVRRGRYEFINISAYIRHKTFEIRGLEGTLDKKLITNWIIAHLTFADLCAKLSIEQVEVFFKQPEQICWMNLKRLALGDTARYFGRVRAKRIHR